MNNRDDRIGDRMDNRGDRWEDRRDRWDDRHDRWDNWHDRHYHHHSHWHHGHWHWHYGPGSRWNYWWNNYPVMTTFGVTTWAVNRVGWAFGYNRYVNPYYSTTYVDNSTYNYSQPIVMTPDEQSFDVAPTDTSPPPGVEPAALTTFEQAQQQFYGGDYPTALKSVDAALKEMPNDTVVHEFRALCLFALERYPESAATLYAVLSVGPGWDWTTMSSLYPKVDVYTAQLRKLEAYRDSKPDDPSGAFVLAYHYITCGHEEAAARELGELVKLTPDDPLAIDLLQQVDPEASVPKPKLTEPPQAVSRPETDALVGAWKANRESGDSFEMTLNDDREFTWSYTPKGGKAQLVRGVWGLDEDGVLALEMNDEGVMLAQLDVKGSDMKFYMLGDMQGSDPLSFKKQ